MTTESFRKEISARLAALSENPDEDATEPFATTLTSADRKYVHRIAESFKLHTQSEGQGPSRFITVYKKDPSGGMKKTHFNQGGPKVPRNTHFSSAASDALSAAAGAGAANVTAGPPASLALSATRGHAPPGSYASCNVDADRHEEMHEKRVQAKPEYMEKMGAHRQRLPAWNQRKEVIEAVQNHDIVLIVGETGCGKSTQVPQFLFDGAVDKPRIMVAQPRRLAATSLAQRVAAERLENLGEKVGYSVPLDEKGGRNAGLVFSTFGSFRHMMMKDPYLSNVTHIVFDEVHERDIVADFALIYLKDLVKKREGSLKLVLMSATLQVETFKKYFEDMSHSYLEIPGRTFPVGRKYMDEVALTLYKDPLLRGFLGPGILSGGLEGNNGEPLDEFEWKKTLFNNVAAPDGMWGLKRFGFDEHIKKPFNKAKFMDGLKKMDVIQQSCLTFDYPIIEALVLFFDRMYKKQCELIEAQIAKGKEEGTAEEDLPKIKDPGAILVFLPGWGDIQAVEKRLTNSLDEERFVILPLHSQVKPEDQRKVFDRMKPGVRKVVLSTNIAEASITVDDCEFVIDSGRAKETSYDANLKVGTLTTSWVSKANAKQRAGRAGRTKDGICFHLFSKDRHEKMDDFLLPELLRSPLEDTVLHALRVLQLTKTGARHENVEEWLAKAPDPPEPKAVKNAVEKLQALGAVSEDGQLTQLGDILAQSPLPPALAKTVIWAGLLGVLDDVITVVTGAAFCRDPFQQSLGSKDDKDKKDDDDDKNGKGKGKGGGPWAIGEAKAKLSDGLLSDHVALLKAVTQFRNSSNKKEFCEKNSLNQRTLESMSKMISKMSGEINEQGGGASGAVNLPGEFANRNRGQMAIVAAVIVAGLFPNIGIRRPASDATVDCELGLVSAAVHSTSAYNTVVPRRGPRNISEADAPPPTKHVPKIYEAEWVAYTELSQVESSHSMKNVTKATPASILLLCGEQPLERNGSELSMLNKFAEFKVDSGAIAEQIVTLRSALRSAFGAAIDPKLIAAHFKETHGEVLDQTCKLLIEACDEPDRGSKRRGDDNYDDRRSKGKSKGKGKGWGGRDSYGNGGGYNRHSTDSRYSYGSDRNRDSDRYNDYHSGKGGGGYRSGKGGGGGGYRGNGGGYGGGGGRRY